jgi:hypothetical protein
VIQDARQTIVAEWDKALIVGNGRRQLQAFSAKQCRRNSPGAKGLPVWQAESPALARSRCRPWRAFVY